MPVRLGILDAIAAKPPRVNRSPSRGNSGHIRGRCGMSRSDWAEWEARLTGDWDQTDSSLEIAEPDEQYSAVDSGVLFVPAALVRIVRCKVCGVEYVNRVFLDDHLAKEHPPSAPRPPKSVPPAVPASRVQPPADSKPAGAYSGVPASRTVRNRNPRGK